MDSLLLNTMAQVAYLQATQLPIGTTTLAGPAASVSFSSISTVYTNLSLKWHARGDNAIAGEQIYMQINGQTGSNYVFEKMEANGTSSITPTQGTAAQAQIGTIPGASGSAGYFGGGNLEMPGAIDGTNYGAFISTGGATPSPSTGFAGVYVGMLAIAGAVSTIKLFPASGNFIAGSRFSLYGWV